MGERNQGFIYHLLLWFLFVSAAVLLFLPTLNRSFSSDDFCILRYLFVEDGYLIPRFFRPVGDITLKWTYQVFGWDPFYYFVINAILHGTNSWLLYLFCSKLIKREEGTYRFLPLIAAIIFLTYHSVSEVVLWTIGRGISLATSFALMSMIVFISSIRTLLKYLLVALFYYIGLASYESILLLPLLLFAIAWLMELKIDLIRWILVLTSTFGLSMATRYFLTGHIWGGYSGVIFDKDASSYFFIFLKTTARIFVPPSERPLMFVLISVFAIILLIFAILKAARKKIFRGRIISIALIGVVISVLVAMFFGVSTRNSEGDRLLYFPSVFYSLLVASLFSALRNTGIRISLLAVFIAGQVYFLSATGKNWVQASAYAGEIINTIKQHAIRPLYLVNLPSDYRGAYIFRNCLREALLHYNVDSSGIVIVNYLRGDNSYTGEIIPKRQNDLYYIWPQTNIQLDGDTVKYLRSGRDRIPSPRLTAENILYWNNRRLLPLK